MSISAKKAPLWGKIAVTVMALVVLAAALGRVAGFVWDYVICGLFFNLIDVLEGLPLSFVVDGYCAWLNVPVDTTYPIFVRIGVAILAFIPKLLLMCCDMLPVLGCVLLPVNLWLLSGKRIGNILSAVSVGIVALGFAARAAVVACFEIIRLVAILLFANVASLSVFRSSLFSLVPALALALLAAVLFLLSLFGMRPKWLSVAVSAVSLSVVGYSAVRDVASAVMNLMQRFNSLVLPSFETLLAQYIGHLPHGLAVNGLHAAVLVTCLIYAIAAQFPRLIGKKA